MDEKTAKPVNNEHLYVSAGKIRNDWMEEIRVLESRLLELKRVGGSSSLHPERYESETVMSGDRQLKTLVMRGSIWEQLMYTQLLNGPDRSKLDKEKNKKPRNRYDNRLGTGLMPDSGWKQS